MLTSNLFQLTQAASNDDYDCPMCKATFLDERAVNAHFFTNHVEPDKHDNATNCNSEPDVRTCFLYYLLYFCITKIIECVYLSTYAF